MELQNKEDQNIKINKGQFWWAIPIVGLLVAVSLLWIIQSNTPGANTLYTSAVADAALAEEGEIEPLVELSSSDALTTWDEQGRVLLLSWHHYPESYQVGQDVKLSYGAVWTFTDKEIANWYHKNRNGVWDWNLRLEQLIGLPPDADYTHVSGFWVDPSDVIRPAYVTDSTAQMQLSFPTDTDPSFVEWFEENSKYSYEESAYPWTRLGYTYDWANNDVEYGLTEFLIEKDASVEVAFTKTTKTFLSWLWQGARIEKANS